MKKKLIIAPLLALLFGLALLGFSVWYTYLFRQQQFFKEIAGIPFSYGEINPEGVYSADGKNSPPCYRIQFKGDSAVFVLRMYGENFDFKKMNEELAKPRAIKILYHPMKNEFGQFEICTITRGPAELYKFNKKFSQVSSGFFGWLLMIAGAVIFLLGIFSFRLRLSGHRERKEDTKKR